MLFHFVSRGYKELQVPQKSKMPLLHWISLVETKLIVILMGRSKIKKKNKLLKCSIRLNLYPPEDYNLKSS